MAGEFTNAFRAASSAVLDAQKLNLLRKQQSFEQSQARQERIKSLLAQNQEQIGQLIEGAKLAKQKGASPEQLDAFRKMIRQMGASLGVPVEGESVSPHLQGQQIRAPIEIPGANNLISSALMRFDTEIGGVLDPTAQAQTEAQAEVARAETFSEKTGVPALDFLRAKGFAPDPAKPTTPLAQTLFDQRLVEKEFGQDSPQAKAMAEALEAEQEGEPASITDVAGLRKEYTRASGEFIATRGAFKRIQDVATGDQEEEGRPQKDMALVFAFMKMLDPESTVREGEYAAAEQTTNIPGEVVRLYNKAVTGDKLSPEQRRGFLKTAKEIMRSQVQFQKQMERQFRGIAERQKMDPQDVVLDYLGEFRDYDQGPNVDIDELSLPQLLDLDPATLTPAQKEALSRKLAEAGY